MLLSMTERVPRCTVLVALAASAVLWGPACRRRRPESGPRLAPYLGKVLGQAEAPIAVDAVLPVNNGCQDALGLYLADVAARYPQVFRVRIFDMRAVEGRAVMAAYGIKCAAVLVEGTTRFDLGGAEGKVLLEGPMDPQDVYRVLQHQARNSAAGSIELPEPADCSAPSPEERRKAGF